MQLSNSEVLFLAQLLFHFKLSSFQSLQDEDKLFDLLERCESHILKNEFKSLKNSSYDNECPWHEEDSSYEEDLPESQNSESESDQEQEDVEAISAKKIIDLEYVRVTDNNGEKAKLTFEKGISKSSVDISLNDGDEILCDIENITRYYEHIEIVHAGGNVNFTVQKFPKSWTSLLKTGIKYKVS